MSISRRDFVAGAAMAGLISAIASREALAESPASAYGIIDLSNSPYAKVRNVPISAVSIQPGFWSKRRATNLQESFPFLHDELLAHGRLNNFLRLSGKSDAPREGAVYTDSDLYKWTEGVAFEVQSGSGTTLDPVAQGIIAAIVAAQEPSGYLDTYFTGDHASERMLPDTLKTGHELYCLGHLLQAGIAYERATGDTTLLDAGKRYVDNFVLPSYGPNPDQKPLFSGHPEVEMALVELYRTTGDRRHLDLAGYILHGDSRIPTTDDERVYYFCGIPFTSRTKLEGHAVRVMYACSGATDYYLETGDPAYWNTLETLWNDLSEHHLYLTGGIGARAAGEAVGDNYELPNESAYCESCAAIGVLMWNWRMLAATGDARHTDMLERALYNNVNSGLALDGRSFCYPNPLALNDAKAIRNPWYDTTCCPTNLVRTFASLPGYFYGTAQDGVYVHLYDNSEMRWQLESGNALRLTQRTDYPWSGHVQIAVAPARPEVFTVHVRIPGWSRTTIVKVNGERVADVTPGTYLALRRRWSGNDVIKLGFDMRPQIVHAHPQVTADAGRVAFQRGPVVYCMEGVDQAVSRKPEDFSAYAVRLDGETVVRQEPNTLDGIVALEHPGIFTAPVAPPSTLYHAGPIPETERSATLRLIPYYAWSNRTPTPMQVWIPKA